MHGTYPRRASEAREAARGHAAVAGNNHGQGSSRENAVPAPRRFGPPVVLARGFARVRRRDPVWRDPVDLGARPLTSAAFSDHDRIERGAVPRVRGPRRALQAGRWVSVSAALDGSGRTVAPRHDLSPRRPGSSPGGTIDRRRERPAA